MPRAITGDLLRFLAANHDIGKFAPGFQNMRSDLGLSCHGPGVADHCAAGMALWEDREVRDALGFASDKELWAKLKLLLITAVGHHGWPPEEQDGRKCWRGGRNKADAVAFASCARTRLPRLQEALEALAEVPEATLREWSWAVAAFISACDWIGSQETFFPYTSPHDAGDYGETSKQRAEQAVQKSGILPTATKPRVEQVLSGAEPRPMQASCGRADLDAPLHIIEDETGSGKTAAALVLAGRWMEAGRAHGVAFLLPTKATAEGMFGSVHEAMSALFPGGGSRVLAFGQRGGSRAWQKVLETVGRDGVEAEVTEWLAQSNKRAFLADATVATVDQALLGVLPTRYQCLRLFGLWGKVVIVDEVHAYDAYQNHLLQRLLAWHLRLGGRAILLSATLPRATRASFLQAMGLDSALSESAYPLHTQGRPNGTCENPVQAAPGIRKPVHVETIESREEIVKRINSEAENGRAVAWVRNTVADAQAAWRMLEPLRDAGVDGMLIHSRFRRRDRNRREEEVKRRLGKNSTRGERGLVVVATQVVEQSLDIDFDLLISDLAPLDLLIQRAGRLHRHARTAKGDPAGEDGRGDAVLLVHAPPWQDDPGKQWLDGDWGGTRAVYGPVHLHRTLDWLRGHDLLVGDDPREGIESVYRDYDDTDPVGLLRAWEEWQGEQMAAGSVAHGVAVKLQEGYDRMIRPTPEENVRTRLGEPSGLVVVLDDEPSSDWQDDALPLPERILRPLQEAHPEWKANERRHPGAVLAVPAKAVGYSTEEGWTWSA